MTTANPGSLHIFVPFVRGIPHLIDALRSVQRQTDQDWSLTVMDNCGPEVAAEDAVMALADPRVAYRRLATHLPMAENWNRCLSGGASDWLVLLHADDEWEPHFLAEVRRLRSAYPDAAALFTAGHTIDARGDEVFSLPDWYKSRLIGRGSGDLVLNGQAGLVRLLRGNFLFASAMCFRRAALATCPYRTDLRFAPDYAIALEMLMGGHTLVGSRSDACCYRRHGAQATLELTKASQRFDEELGLYKEFQRRCEQRGWMTAADVARRHLSLRANLLVHAIGQARRLDFHAAGSTLQRAITR